MKRYELVAAWRPPGTPEMAVRVLAQQADRGYCPRCGQEQGPKRPTLLVRIGLDAWRASVCEPCSLDAALHEILGALWNAVLRREPPTRADARREHHGGWVHPPTALCYGAGALLWSSRTGRAMVDMPWNAAVGAAGREWLYAEAPSPKS